MEKETKEIVRVASKIIQNSLWRNYVNSLVVLRPRFEE